jgi:hypothetical protein
MPLTPTLHAAAKRSTPIPFGLTAPIPVMTTRMRSKRDTDLSPSPGHPGEGWGDGDLERPAILADRNDRHLMRNNDADRLGRSASEGV